MSIAEVNMISLVVGLDESPVAAIDDGREECLER